MKMKNDPRLLQSASGQTGKGNSCLKNSISVIHASSLVAGAALAVGLLLSVPKPALADTGREPETVFIGLATPEESITPAPSPRPWRPDADQGDAEILARLLWSSPLTSEDDKRRLCWLVFNRIDDERYGLFGASVETVVIKREFTFYDKKAYISETNLRIARDELSRWTAERMGIPVERPLEADYLYLRFDGHTVTFLKER